MSYDYHSRAVQKAMSDRDVAIRACTPYAGGADLMALDSVEKIYRLTLDAIGVRHHGVRAADLPPLLDAGKWRATPGRPVMAMDAGATQSFLSRNPDAARIRVMG